MIRSQLEDLPIKEWILPVLVGLALSPIMWLASKHLLGVVPGPADALTGQIGEIGVVLLTGALAIALMTGVIVVLGEITLRVRQKA